MGDVELALPVRGAFLTMMLDSPLDQSVVAGVDPYERPRRPLTNRRGPEVRQRDLARLRHDHRERPLQGPALLQRERHTPL